jgi:hypothetical protein
MSRGGSLLFLRIMWRCVNWSPTFVAEGVEATVKPEIREVVEATARLGRAEVCQADLKAALKLDKSAVSRRVAGALGGGFLKDLEDRKGRPARLVLGDPLPANRDMLPRPIALLAANSYTVARLIWGIRCPPLGLQSKRAIWMNRTIPAADSFSGRRGYDRRSSS